VSGLLLSAMRTHSTRSMSLLSVLIQAGGQHIAEQCGECAAWLGGQHAAHNMHAHPPKAALEVLQVAASTGVCLVVLYAGAVCWLLLLADYWAVHCMASQRSSMLFLMLTHAHYCHVQRPVASAGR
jgi:hypothetical protein